MTRRLGEDWIISRCNHAILGRCLILRGSLVLRVHRAILYYAAYVTASLV